MHLYATKAAVRTTIDDINPALPVIIYIYIYIYNNLHSLGSLRYCRIYNINSRPGIHHYVYATIINYHKYR